MPVFRLTIEYDGSGFHGWQAQPNTRTVQGELERALGTVLGLEIVLQGASRTDAGVHALGQVASLEVDTDASTERIARGVSALAGPDAAVVEAAIAPDGFNARRDSVGKYYRYSVFNRPAPSPLRAGTSWHVARPLDDDRMCRAAERLVGTHDFAGFRAADCGRESTRRTLTRVEPNVRGDGSIDIEIEGTAFLKNMVRIIAGTLVDIGLGKRPVSIVDDALDARDRTLAGPTAPAHGLTLVQVMYPEGWIRDRA